MTETYPGQISRPCFSSVCFRLGSKWLLLDGLLALPGAFCRLHICSSGQVNTWKLYQNPSCEVSSESANILRSWKGHLLLQVGCCRGKYNLGLRGICTTAKTPSWCNWNEKNFTFINYIFPSENSLWKPMTHICLANLTVPWPTWTLLQVRVRSSESSFLGRMSLLSRNILIDPRTSFCEFTQAKRSSYKEEIS